jgi:hypothetical protein
MGLIIGKFKNNAIASTCALAILCIGWVAYEYYIEYYELDAYNYLALAYVLLAIIIIPLLLSKSSKLGTITCNECGYVGKVKWIFLAGQYRMACTSCNSVDWVKKHQ